MPCLLQNETIQMPSVSSQPFSVFLPGRGDERNKVSLFYKWSENVRTFLSMVLSQSGGETNYDCSRKALPDMYCLNLCSVGICFVDSHFVRCIFIWRCQRIPTHLDPPPAKSLYQASLWLQVELPKGCASELKTKLSRLDIFTYRFWVQTLSPEVVLQWKLGPAWIGQFGTNCGNGLLKEFLLCEYTVSKLSIIWYSGNIGTELSSTTMGMFLTSDAGNSWRQVRLVFTVHDAFILKVKLEANVCFSMFTDADF